MLTETQAQNLYKKFNLTQKQIDMVEAIRKGQPIRNTQGNRRNMSSRYPSRMMKVIIQTESRTNERPAMLTCYEANKKCYEVYDQPTKLTLIYLVKSGKRYYTAYHTVDYFVIEESGLYFDEWKYEQELEDLAIKSPYRYVKDEDGTWRCPPGEVAAAAYGAKYRLRTPKDIDFNLMNNWDFFQDYFDDECPDVNEDVKRFLIEYVGERPGITLVDLFLLSDLDRDDLFTMIAKGHLYIDLAAERVTNPEKVYVYISEKIASIYQGIHKPKLEEIDEFSVHPGALFLLDGKTLMLFSLGEEIVYLQHEDDKSKPLELPKEVFDDWLKTGKLIGLEKSKSNLERHPEAARIWKRASFEDRDEATKMSLALDAWIEGSSPEEIAEIYGKKVPERTLYDWQARRRNAEAKWGDGYIGLIKRRADQGNYEKKLPVDAELKLAIFISEKYETFTEPSMYGIWVRYKDECETEGIRFGSYQTFCTRVNERDEEEQTAKRQGHRAANAVRIPYLYLDRDTPRHGERALQIVHIDHTKFDIEAKHSVTNSNLGRIEGSLAIDANTRNGLAAVVGYDKPSYRTILLLLLDIVRRYGRLPQIIVVDNAPEFKSVWFQTILARYKVEIMYRPKGDPKSGQAIERLFGTTNTEFIYECIGNTQAAKRARQMVKSNNPKDLTIWNVRWFYAALCEFLFQTYNNMNHPAVQEAPNKAFSRSLLTWGFRKFKRIIFERFKTELLPSPTYNNGYREISKDGILVHYVYYKATHMPSTWIGKVVKVKYDPFDFSTIYAYINNEWVVFKSQYEVLFKNRTEKEMQLIFEEIKKSHAETKSSRLTINAEILAKFLKRLDDYQEILSQHVKDVESLGIGDAIKDNLDQDEMAKRLMRLSKHTIELDDTVTTAAANLAIDSDEKHEIKPAEPGKYNYTKPEDY